MKYITTTTPTEPTAEATREPTRRRNWLILGLTVLLIVTAGVVGWWIGSSGSDETASDAGEMPEVLEEFYDALLEGDSTAMAALFTEDGRLTGPQELPTRSNLSPPAMIRTMMEGWFSYVDYTNIETLDVLSEGNTVMVVSRWDGMAATHQRPSKTPFSTTVVEVFELSDGLIAQYDVFFDYDDLGNQ